MGTNFVEGVRKVAGSLGPVSLPIRLVIGALVSAIGSAGVAGFLTKLGAYWYVLYYGVRTPADGIPFVAETAAVVSFVITLSAAAIYLAAWTVLTALRSFKSEDDVEFPTWKRVVLLPVALLAILFIMSGWLAVVRSVGLQGKEVVAPVVMMLAVGTMGAVKRISPIGCGMAMAGLVVAASFLLWYPPTYGWFLRTIGHGGGRYVTVHLHDQPFPRMMKGYLIVRTGTALFLFDGEHTISEVPSKLVGRIDQDTSVYWCLPGCDCRPVAPKPAERSAADWRSEMPKPRTFELP